MRPNPSAVASWPAGWRTRPIPLTARVMVNRVWHYHFGTGLVATPNDLGRNGERPSHPELLDWLAADFLAHGTSLKALHRRIMLSNTYRQSSRYDARAAAVDADDRLLWRYPARRLEAEAIRDAMLAASGLLNSQMAGPSFRPFTLTVFNSSFYNLADFGGPAYDRRTVYRININSAKDPLLETLDCPDPSVKAPRRAVTTTPLQALGLMNDPFVIRQARALAESGEARGRPRDRRSGRSNLSPHARPAPGSRRTPAGHRPGVRGRPGGAWLDALQLERIPVRPVDRAKDPRVDGDDSCRLVRHIRSRHENGSSPVRPSAPRSARSIRSGRSAIGSDTMPSSHRGDPAEFVKDPRRGL